MDIPIKTYAARYVYKLAVVVQLRFAILQKKCSMFHRLTSLQTRFTPRIEIRIVPRIRSLPYPVPFSFLSSFILPFLFTGALVQLSPSFQGTYQMARYNMYKLDDVSRVQL